MKKLISAILLLCLCLSLAACGAPAADAPAADSTSAADSTPAADSAPAAGEQELIMTLVGGSLGYPNPFKHSSKGQGTIKMWHLYDALLEKDENGLIPWLAQDYAISDDGLSYTFTLRPDLKWSDGEALTVDDVIFTYEYYRENEPVVSNLYVDGQYIIEYVRDNGDGSFTVGVNDVMATNLSYISRVPIIPKHIWADVEDPFNYSGAGDCVGSGPYVLTAIDEEKGEYQFRANEYFWGERLIDGIDYVAVSDDVLAFDNGEIDYLNAPWDLYDKYANEPGCLASSNLPFLGYNLIFNMQQVPELGDVSLRQAMAYGIDRQNIIDLVYNGHGTVASAAYLPEGHPMRNDSVRTYDYDAERAAELLDGRSFSFTLKCGESQEQIKVCELVKMYLGEIGIDIEVISCDSATLRQAYSTGDYELYMSYGGGWGADADKLHIMYAGFDPESGQALYSSAVLGYYNEALFDLAQRQQRCVDAAQRTELIYEMQEIIAEELPSLPILNVYDMLVTRPEKYDGWRFCYDYNYSDGVKLSFAVAP